MHTIRFFKGLKTLIKFYLSSLSFERTSHPHELLYRPPDLTMAGSHELFSPSSLSFLRRVDTNAVRFHYWTAIDTPPLMTLIAFVLYLYLISFFIFFLFFLFCKRYRSKIISYILVQVFWPEKWSEKVRS